MYVTTPLYIHRNRNPRGRPYDTELRGSVHVYKTALLLVEDGIDSNPEAFPFFLFDFLFTACFFYSWRSLCRTAVHKDTRLTYGHFNTNATAMDNNYNYNMI